MQGRHRIKKLSATRKVIALAFAESEYHRLVRGAAVRVELVNLAADYGRTLRPWLQTDATGALDIARRRGAERVRHIETGMLWLQRHITAKTIDVTKIPGLQSWVGLGTKHLPWADQAKCVKGLGFVLRLDVRKARRTSRQGEAVWLERLRLLALLLRRSSEKPRLAQPAR